MSIEYVAAADPNHGVELWSADDIREATGDPESFTGEHIGILFHSGGQDGSGYADGAVVYGTEAEVIGMLERAIALVRREHKRVYGKPAARPAVPGPGCRRIVAEEV